MGGGEEEKGAKKMEFQGKPGALYITQNFWAIPEEERSPMEISHGARPFASYPDRSFRTSGLEASTCHRLVCGPPGAVSKLLASVL